MPGSQNRLQLAGRDEAFAVETGECFHRFWEAKFEEVFVFVIEIIRKSSQCLGFVGYVKYIKVLYF